MAKPASAVLPPHGHCRELLSYLKAEVVYDLTCHFGQKFLSRGDRTIDQMVQAPRAGTQNIAGASNASGASKDAEIRLTTVARTSLAELLATADAGSCFARRSG